MKARSKVSAIVCISWGALPKSKSARFLWIEIWSCCLNFFSMSTVQAPLSQGVGYWVVVGLGVAFALGKFCLAVWWELLTVPNRNGTRYSPDEKVFQWRQQIHRNVRWSRIDEGVAVLMSNTGLWWQTEASVLDWRLLLSYLRGLILLLSLVPRESEQKYNRRILANFVDILRRTTKLEFSVTASWRW